MNTRTLLYKDKPLFGLDIGFNSIKVMQLESDAKKNQVIGYGAATFDSSAVKDGVIVDYDVLATAIQDLFDKAIIGKITTRRVAATVQAARSYSRIINLPNKLGPKDLAEAVRFEVEQYIPIPINDLYTDFVVSHRNPESMDVHVVAVPKSIIDSYMKLFDILGLEVCMLETTITATSRTIALSEHSNDVPTIIIDYGSLSVDLTIYDKFVVVNGTVPGGGDDLTNRIAKQLNVTPQEANTIKTRYGLSVSKRQDEVRMALSPQLDELIHEIRRVIRYYEDRAEGKSQIGQIITMGGGANMPGLSEYLTDALRIPTRMCNFWHEFHLHKLQPPSDVEKAVYVTAAGAALVNPREIWK